MDIRDLRIDTYTNSSKLIHMKIFHNPTWFFVEGKGESRHKLKEKLIKELEILIEAEKFI